jgi:hypothetical protein
MMDAFERAAQREHDIRRQHREQRRAHSTRSGFRIHATVYVGVQLLLVSIWALAGAGYPWFLYPLLGWGIGLVAHYAAVRDRFRNRPYNHG